METPYPVTEPRFAPEQIRQRLQTVREELAAMDSSGKVRLMAVTKTVPVEVINYAIDELGITLIGENRVQELLSKYDSLHQPPNVPLEIHLIGTLQANKVKYIIDKVDMIESLDSLKLAAEIDRQAKKHGKTMDVLIEVNIGREPQKGGILPEDLPEFLLALTAFDSLKIRGLMTIAPKSDDMTAYSKYFSEISQIFIDISEKISHNIYDGRFYADFDILSMGMSSSWKEAVRNGTREIRLGSSVFGERNYTSAEIADGSDTATV